MKLTGFVRLLIGSRCFRTNGPLEREPINIHKVLERVKEVSKTGFARKFKINEDAIHLYLWWMKWGISWFKYF